MEAEPEAEASLFPATVGDKLRSAREAQGVDLSEVAARTRIPQRHLEAIERSSYSALPSITYAIGFAKSYARAVGADEVAIARELRGELEHVGHDRPTVVPAYEMSDPTRTPPRGLVWVGLIVALLVLAGAGIWYGTDLFRGGAPSVETLITEETPAATPTAAPTGVAETGGQVSLIALGPVWLRINDGSGNRLFEKELAQGERYDVPADAQNPVAITSRAESIQVTLNGSNVAPLGPPSTRVEVGVSGDALRTRATAPSPPEAGSPPPANATAP